MKRIISTVVLSAAGWMGAFAIEPASSLKESMDQFMSGAVASNEVPGIATLVGDRENRLFLGAHGMANLEEGIPMKTDSIVWIASMTKPVTGVAVMMLAEQGALSLDDPVAKYLPEFGGLKDEAGKESNITIANCLSHTAGLQELTPEEERSTHDLRQLAAITANKPVKFAPGTRWTYCQTGMSVAARIVEVVSNETFPEFLQKRLFDPLGMNDTTFYLSGAQVPRLACSYEKAADGLMTPVPPYFLHGRSPTDRSRYPRASGGLFSTAEDYGKFARMILRGGEVDGRRYLKPETIAAMARSHTAGLHAGFVPGSGYGMGWILVEEPTGVTAPLSAGSFGHGGAYGTQAWIDPVKERYTIMIIQRSNLGNGDGSEIRRQFQKAAATES